MAPRGLTDSASQLRSATRRAKSDVANKLISMFLHELSRKISEHWAIKVESKEYESLVRERFNGQCPYCSGDLGILGAVIEHLDGMNRLRAGLHVPGNVLVACKRCNGEKRRDDSLKVLVLAATGWESFLSHDGARCVGMCGTCRYWQNVWPDESERRLHLAENIQRIIAFRKEFAEFERILPSMKEALPPLLTKLYVDCQSFADREIKSLLEKFEQPTNTRL